MSVYYRFILRSNLALAASLLGYARWFRLGLPDWRESPNVFSGITSRVKRRRAGLGVCLDALSLDAWLSLNCRAVFAFLTVRRTKAADALAAAFHDISAGDR